MKKFFSICGCTAFFFLIFCYNLDAQTFGKNKVQYEAFEWKEFETGKLKVYYCSGSENLAFYAAHVGDRAAEEYCRDFNHLLSDKIPLIIYNSHNDFEQTNVINQLLPEEVGGFTEFFKQRVVIPFEGSYEQFYHVVRHELVHAVMFDMLYGQSFSQAISAQVQLNIPLWLAEGLAEYESIRWDTNADMILRDAVINGYLPSMTNLNMYLAYKGGQSLLKYIADKYGHNKIGEIMSRIRISRDVEEGFKIATGRDFNKLNSEWHIAMRKQYWPEIRGKAAPAEFSRKLTDHVKWANYYNTSPAVSPDGSSIAFLSDKSAYSDILLYDLTEGKMGKRLVKGERSASFEEMHWLRPGISWAPDCSRITFAAKRGGEDALYIVDTESGDVLEKYTFGLDAIFYPSWSPDGSKIAFSGVQAGKSDIYYVDLDDPGEIKTLTNDIYSDEEPAWDAGSGSVFFLSDRGGCPENGENQDNFIYDCDVQLFNIFRVTLDGEMTTLTNDSSRERSPFCTADGSTLIYISDQNGVNNIYFHPLDKESEPYPITNVLTGCFNPTITGDGSLLVFSSFYQGGWDVYSMDNPFSTKQGDLSIEPTLYMEETRAVRVVGRSARPAGVSTVREPLIFEKEIEKKDDEKSSVIQVEEEEEDVVTESGEELTAPDGTVYKVDDYRISFSPDLVYGSAGYNPYFGFLGYSQIALSDQLGDHRIYFALDLFSDLESSNIMIRYLYLPHKIDYGVGGYHNTFYSIGSDAEMVENLEDEYPYSYFFIKDRIYGFGLSFSRPFTKFDRVDFRLSFSGISREYLDYWTLDKIGGEQRYLFYPSLFYSHDTVLWGSTGPVDGSRWLGGMSLSPAIGKEKEQIEFLTFITDYRKYWFINKVYSFAFRIFAAGSLGDSPEKFYLGGMDNWLNYRLGEDAYSVGIEDIYFSTFVTPLRGWRYYDQTGSSVALGNISFRFPMIRQLKMGWPLPLEMYNVRGSLFLDIGGAWDSFEEFDPVDKLTSGFYKLDDLKAGYGIGFRMNLGMFVLLFDIAWPTDFDSVLSPAVYYFSMGSEF